MKITAIREKTLPISSPIRNAYIDFSRMTLSLVAVVTDVELDMLNEHGWSWRLVIPHAGHQMSLSMTASGDKRGNADKHVLHRIIRSSFRVSGTRAGKSSARG